MVILNRTIPHKLCGCEVKDVYVFQSFVSTLSEESDSLLVSPSVYDRKCF